MNTLHQSLTELLGKLEENGTLTKEELNVAE